MSSLRKENSCCLLKIAERFSSAPISYPYHPISYPYHQLLYPISFQLPYHFRLGANWGSDNEILIAKFRLKLKKVGKTTKPLRHDLNQIPYNYTVEVRNRFKGLDLIDRVPDELWSEVHYIVQETGIKTIPKKEVMQKKSKMAVWGGLTKNCGGKKS